MNQLIITFSLFFGLLSCEAQSPVLPLYNRTQEATPGCYLKDMDNDFNKFIGSWKWENGNNSIVFEFLKQEMVNDGREYWDYLIGEYRYVENGVEKVNTLPVEYKEDPYKEPDINHLVGANFSLRGNPSCPECAPNTRFVKFHIEDPTRIGVGGKVWVGHYVENGVEKIKVRIYKSIIDSVRQDYNGATELSIPEGDYTFIKQ